MIAIEILIAILATWRITRMVQNENLPFNLGGRFRKRLAIREYHGGNFDEIKPGSVRDLFNCFKCLSFWVALPMANFITGGFWQVLALTLAINAAAILLEHYAERRGM